MLRQKKLYSFLSLPDPCKWKFLVFFTLCVCLKGFTQDKIISGRIIDATTGLPVYSCSVYGVGSQFGIFSDSLGYYKLLIGFRTDSIATSMIGYKPVTAKVSDEPEQEINFFLEPIANDIGEVIVAAKTKLTRAQRLILKVIEHKEENNIYQQDNFKCNVYDKLELDLKNIPGHIRRNILLKPMAFIFENMDTVNGTDRVLPFYLTESLADYYFQRSPLKEAYIYRGYKNSSLENNNIKNLVNNKSIFAYIDGLYKNVNVYKNNIKIADINFTSPVSDNALNIYRYKIIDTSYRDNLKYIRLSYEPLKFRTNVFNGEILIVDSVYAVSEVKMNVDKNAGLNFIKRLEISQEFRVEANKFHPFRNKILAEMEAAEIKKAGVIAIKTTLYKNFIINGNLLLPDNEAEKVEHLDDTINWEVARFEPLTLSESSVYKLMDTLNNLPAVKKNTKLIVALATGYYAVGKVEIGNLYGIYSNNRIEGSRITLGLRTNNLFSKKVQLSGYGGWAFGNNTPRYNLTSILVLNRYRWSTLQLSYSNDIGSVYKNDDALGQVSAFSNLFRRVRSGELRLVNRQEINIKYLKQFNPNIRFEFGVLNSKLTPYFNTYFTDGRFTPFIVVKPGINNSYFINELSFAMRFSYREKSITRNFRRYTISTNYPVLTIEYKKGLKAGTDIFRGDFKYNKWNFNIFQDVTIGRLGMLNYSIDAGITDGNVPVVLLDVPSGNDTYYYSKTGFNNMRRFEFAMDRYVQLHVQQSFGNFPFKYIPLPVKLKWRSLATFKSVIGNMSEENKTANKYYDATTSYSFTIPNKSPYMEAGVGIENILKILRFDAVWRLNYLEGGKIPRFGLRGSLQFKF